MLSEVIAVKRTIDVGRVVMLSIFLVLTLGAVAKFSFMLQTDFTFLRFTSSVLSLAFYGLFAWAYFRRGPAKATSDNKMVWILAPVATFFPFVLPFFASPHNSQIAFVVGNVLLIVGLLFSVYSVWCLDKNLSIVPQARKLVDSGPYSIIRHPLYLGEIVALLGLVIVSGGAASVVVWVFIVSLQCYRARQEEKLLSVSLDGYAAYRQRTSCVIPGIF